MNKEKAVIYLIAVFCIVSLAIAEPEIPKQVENDDFSITSTQEVYYCEPIISDFGCLIPIEFNITAKKIKTSDSGIELAFSTDKVKIKDFDGLDVKSNNNKLQIKFDKKQDYQFHANIWALEDGKFNINIFDGATLLLSLDPFINVTINSSYPSYWLINGTNNISNINQYQQTIENSAGLSDAYTYTNYTTRNYYIMSMKYIKNQTDGVFEGTDYITTTGEIVAVNFTISDVSLVSNPKLCIYGSQRSVATVINYTVQTVFTNKTIILPISITPASWECINISVSTLSSGVNRLGFGCSYCSSPQDRLYIDYDTSAPINGTSYYWDGVTWTQRTTLDYGIALIYTIITPNYSKGMALQPFFNYTFNLTNHTYWLNIQSNATSVQDVKVYAYLNQTHINTSSYVTETLTSQSEFINIMPLLYSGYHEAFRVFTIGTEFAVTDMFLYEQSFEDTIPPNITNCTMNVTSLSCGEYAHVQCMVTDDGFIDKVWFYGQHPNGTYQSIQLFKYNGTDYYSVDLFYTDCYSDIKTGEFISVNATDINGNSATYSPNITFNYTCICSANFNCYYNSQPFLKSNLFGITTRDRIDWLCSIDRSDVTCLSQVWKDGVMLQTNPALKSIEGIGKIVSFDSGTYPYNYFRVWFNKENLLPDEEFNFTVICSGDDTYQTSYLVTPTYKNFDVVAYRGVWLKQYIGYIIIIIGLIICGAILWGISNT